MDPKMYDLLVNTFEVNRSIVDTYKATGRDFDSEWRANVAAIDSPDFTTIYQRIYYIALAETFSVDPDRHDWLDYAEASVNYILGIIYNCRNLELGLSECRECGLL